MHLSIGIWSSFAVGDPCVKVFCPWMEIPLFYFLFSCVASEIYKGMCYITDYIVLVLIADRSAARFKA
jgi:hypothetical protein